MSGQDEWLVGSATKGSAPGRPTSATGRAGGSVPERAHHAACVDACLERSGKDPPPEVLLRFLEVALGALWARTTTTLGEVTLTAIAERVLHTASETFPIFSSLKVEPSGGIPFREFRQRLSSVHDSGLTQGIRFVLVEFLTVLGHLTAEVLTPELHAELLNVALPGAVQVAQGLAGIPIDRPNTEGEVKKS
jgi:hypothetical protein